MGRKRWILRILERKEWLINGNSSVLCLSPEATAVVSIVCLKSKTKDTLETV